MDKPFCNQSSSMPPSSMPHSGCGLNRPPAVKSGAGQRRLWRRICWGLLPLIGAGSLWGLPAAIAPPAAIAYTTRLNIFLSREQTESFDALLRRAEITARAGVQRSFDADILTSEALITVVADNQGITVPLMTVEVTRSQWRTRPDVEYWARYYETARILLAL